MLGISRRKVADEVVNSLRRHTIRNVVSARKISTSSLRFDEDKTTASPKIYTKTGDGGESSLFNGERRHKSSLIFDAMGDVDEVSSHVGLSKNRLMESWQHENFKDIALQFEKIQCCLQDVNSCIATPASSSTQKRIEKTKFDAYLTKELEHLIDSFTSELPALKNFILPSGGLAASHIHVTRTVCRRAERKVSSLVLSEGTPPEVGQYMNRLSDYLFTIARYVAMMEGHVEKIYKKPKPGKSDNGAISNDKSD